MATVEAPTHSTNATTTTMGIPLHYPTAVYDVSPLKQLCIKSLAASTLPLLDSDPKLMAAVAAYDRLRSAGFESLEDLTDPANRSIVSQVLTATDNSPTSSNINDVISFNPVAINRLIREANLEIVQRMSVRDHLTSLDAIRKLENIHEVLLKRLEHQQHHLETVTTQLRAELRAVNADLEGWKRRWNTVPVAAVAACPPVADMEQKYSGNEISSATSTVAAATGLVVPPFQITSINWHRRHTLLPELSASGVAVSITDLVNETRPDAEFGLFHHFGLTNIVEIDFTNCATISSIAMLPTHRLTVLNLTSTSVSQEGLGGAEAPFLETLILKNCTGISDLRLLLRGCQTLRQLHLQNTSVGQEGIAGLRTPFLERLNLNGCRGITNIAVLFFGAEDAYGGGVLHHGANGGGGGGSSGDNSNRGTGCRGGWTLRRLDLQGTSVTQEGIAGIEAPRMENLNLHGCHNITDVSGLLKGCRTLSVLYLGDSGVACRDNVWNNP